ncbi:MAG: hypothetical protein V1735_05870 [Nanoarchaeota archaeon]
MEKVDTLFIGIRDPQEVRRDILESTRSLIMMLKRFDEQKKLHEEKLQKLNELKALSREVDRLTVKLRVQLPKTKIAMILEEKKRIDRMIPHMEKKSAKKSRATKAPMLEEPLPVQHKGEITQLEAELADIEEKLGKLQ